MKVLYVRISTTDQKTDRQKITEKDYGHVIEDKCSGSIPFFERTGGKEVNKLIEKNILSSLSVISIDRLGRNLKDILNTLEYFTEKKIPVFFVNQGLCTLDTEGKENPIAKLIISILGIVAEMERNQILERQREGIEIAKMKGVYKGRRKGAKEDVLNFLLKPKNKKVLECLKRGLNATETAKIVGVHTNTVYKVRNQSLIRQNA
jgi:DNA invertase Pin-like site-specific DNA recombinase